jgi:hypothetical protein
LGEALKMILCITTILLIITLHATHTGFSFFDRAKIPTRSQACIDRSLAPSRIAMEQQSEQLTSYDSTVGPLFFAFLVVPRV